MGFVPKSLVLVEQLQDVVDDAAPATGFNGRTYARSGLTNVILRLVGCFTKAT